MSLHGKLLRSLRLASPCRLVFQISVFMRVVRAVLVLLVRVLAAAVAAGLVSEPLR